MTTGSAGSGRIVVAGSSNTDLVCLTDRLPGPGETVASSSFSIYPGGKAANQAVAAARAGADVTFIGCFGGDSYGRDRRQELDAEGIDLGLARVIEEEPSGLALIAVDASGENLIITVGGANDRTSVDQLRAAVEQKRPDVVLLPNEAPADVVALAISGAGSAATIFNAAPFTEPLRDLAGEVDVLICNEVEAAQFLARPVTLDSAGVDVHDLASLARGQAVITLGAGGAVGWSGGSLHQSPALPVDVLDTTGAGDAFCGVFAAWLARGSSFKDALRAGTVAGSLATTIAGAQPSLPRLAEIEDRIEMAL